ncbi:MAG: hypothetical protein WC726_01390 [Parcubacteria group bacterium]|jgi:hypothetical protein
MCAELTPNAKEKLSDPVFMLQTFIGVEEQSLERARSQLKKEHESVMTERAKLPIWHQPMDAPYWLRRNNEISRRAKALEEAKAKLRELEKQRAE